VYVSRTEKKETEGDGSFRRCRCHEREGGKKKVKYKKDFSSPSSSKEEKNTLQIEE
jgi:hypothetical protein